MFDLDFILMVTVFTSLVFCEKLDMYDLKWDLRSELQHQKSEIASLRHDNDIIKQYFDVCSQKMKDLQEELINQKSIVEQTTHDIESLKRISTEHDDKIRNLQVETHSKQKIMRNQHDITSNWFQQKPVQNTDNVGKQDFHMPILNKITTEKGIREVMHFNDNPPKNIVLPINADLNQVHIRVQRQVSNRVAFTYQNREDLTYIGVGQTIKFDSKVLDITSSYKVVTGVFRAPFTGIYVLFTNIRMLPGHHVCFIEIMQEGRILTSVFAKSDEGSYASDSALVMTHVNAGEDIWLNNRHYCDSCSCQIDDSSSFSGFLLY